MWALVCCRDQCRARHARVMQGLTQPPGAPLACCRALCSLGQGRAQIGVRSELGCAVGSVQGTSWQGCWHGSTFCKTQSKSQVG